MRYVVVSMRDSAADCFSRPMFFASKGEAIRAFSDEVQRESADNNLFKHPADFELYYLGTFDDSNGKFDFVDYPEPLIRAVECVRKSN